jgi:hypothetical protein
MRPGSATNPAMCQWNLRKCERGSREPSHPRSDLALQTQIYRPCYAAVRAKKNILVVGSFARFLVFFILGMGVFLYCFLRA